MAHIPDLAAPHSSYSGTRNCPWRHKGHTKPRRIVGFNQAPHAALVTAAICQQQGLGPCFTAVAEVLQKAARRVAHASDGQRKMMDTPLNAWALNNALALSHIEAVAKEGSAECLICTAVHALQLIGAGGDWEASATRSDALAEAGLFPAALSASLLVRL